MSQVTDPAAPLDPVTLVGLVLEAAEALHHHLSPGIERELGVRGHAFNVLVRLARSPGEQLRMSDIAAQTGLSPGGLTRSVDRLVALGFVTRQSCAHDRRSSYARLTELGSERCAAAVRRHREEIARLFDGLLGEQDATQLTALLRRIRDALRPDAARVSDPPATLSR